jgi:uncharacterized protein DUF6714
MMPSCNEVILKVRTAFDSNEYPGDAYLVGSSEGCEPEDEAGAFRGRRDWQSIRSEFLDQHYPALSFFSEAGFRFFLPAYLIADLRGELKTADPLFHLAGGFSETQVSMDVAGRTFVRASGQSALINPRRFGAMTQFDYVRMRLSVFAREEAAAIVEYLRWKHEETDLPTEKAFIDSALDGYWLERTATAPSAERLRQHLEDEAEFVRALQQKAPL